MKPVRLLKRLAAATATGLLAMGLVAGTASAASANSGDVAFTVQGGNSGDVALVAPQDNSGDVAVATPQGGNSGDVA